MDISNGVRDVQDGQEYANEECHSPIANMYANEGEDDAGSLRYGSAGVGSRGTTS